MEGYTREGLLKVLPGLNCGVCGEKSCEQFAQRVLKDPKSIIRCIHLDRKACAGETSQAPSACSGCGNGAFDGDASGWKDSLGREIEFILDTFPQDPGPRETIILRNPNRVKELAIQEGDILIGRPLGMSCGCPITHCGVVMSVDALNGVIVWCVTGPLNPRSGAHKDVGYYSAEAYEGIVKASAKELKIGMRYWFLPHRCMLQWRHSGLINFINRHNGQTQIRIEGLFIG